MTQGRLCCSLSHLSNFALELFMFTGTVLKRSDDCRCAPHPLKCFLLDSGNTSSIGNRAYSAEIFALWNHSPPRQFGGSGGAWGGDSSAMGHSAYRHLCGILLNALSDPFI